MRDLLVGLGLLCCPAAVFVVFGTSGMEAFEDTANARAPVEAVEQGRVAFAGECARCHGRLARGTARGPDLMRAEYGPGIFSDDLFRRAVRDGVAARSGGAGMPAMRDMPEPRLDRIIGFLRELQRRHGIR